MVTSWTCMFLMLFVMVITADKDKVCDSNSQVHAAGLCGLYSQNWLIYQCMMVISNTLQLFCRIVQWTVNFLLQISFIRDGYNC
jgi:succinate-acetate transporter protein